MNTWTHNTGGSDQDQPQEKKCKKAKWLSEEALQIAEKRREVKGKRGKERYTHLNAEFQRIARRDKKAFLGDQCKEVEENNRMRKTRDLFTHADCWPAVEKLADVVVPTVVACDVVKNAVTLARHQFSVAEEGVPAIEMI